MDQWTEAGRAGRQAAVKDENKPIYETNGHQSEKAAGDQMNVKELRAVPSPTFFPKASRVAFGRSPKLTQTQLAGAQVQYSRPMRECSSGRPGSLPYGSSVSA
jgi:hypothetical protein